MTVEQRGPTLDVCFRELSAKEYDCRRMTGINSGLLLEGVVRLIENT